MLAFRNWGLRCFSWIHPPASNSRKTFKIQGFLPPNPPTCWIHIRLAYGTSWLGKSHQKIFFFFFFGVGIHFPEIGMSQWCHQESELSDFSVSRVIPDCSLEKSSFSSHPFHYPWKYLLIAFSSCTASYILQKNSSRKCLHLIWPTILIKPNILTFNFR